MKKLVQLFLLCAGIQMLSAQSPYYYYNGRKIELTVNREYLNIITDDKVQVSFSDSLRSLGIELHTTKDKALDAKIQKIKWNKGTDKAGYDGMVKALKTRSNIKHVLPYFERGEAEPIGISDIFYVKLKNERDSVLLKKYAQRMNVSIVKQVPYMPLWFIMQLQDSKNGNTIDVSNKFYESGQFEDIDPAFMFNFRQTCTNDPMFSQLWGLSNSSNQALDINACEAWNISLGTGVKVAVVDQGIYASHNDLAANIHSLSFDAQSGTSPSVFISGNNHGTHVAGIIAAVRNNNLQVVGVAPGSKIMRVSHDLYITTTYSAEMASGISWARQNGADVINNSWGDQGGLLTQMHSTILENAITTAITQGRNNKGCVVVFASGNFGSTMDYPGNFHSDILTVGSINSSGQRSIFTSPKNSGYGTMLDVVAPGSNILSTMPYNSTDYNSGTSMAAPHVAGIAALILSVNASLTSAQVRRAIESTCTKLPSYTFSNTYGHNSNTWNAEVGYGLVNAYAAVRSAVYTPEHTEYTATMGIESGGYWADVTCTATSGIDSYAWDIVGGSSTGWTITQHPNSVSSKPSMHRVKVTAVNSNVTNGVILRVCPHNSAGWGECTPVGYLNYSGGVYYSMSVFPNPASGLLTVNIEEDQAALSIVNVPQQSSPSGSGILAPPPAPQAPAVYELRLYNISGTLVYQSTMTADMPAQINVSGLPNGIYTLHVDDGSGNPPQTQQVVVAH